MADTLAAAGNLMQTSRGQGLRDVWLLLIGAAASAFTGSGITLEITALASRAFPFYYMMQYLVAISVSHLGTQKKGFRAVAVALAFIAVSPFLAN